MKTSLPEIMPITGPEFSPQPHQPLQSSAQEQHGGGQGGMSNNVKLVRKSCVNPIIGDGISPADSGVNEGTASQKRITLVTRGH